MLKLLVETFSCFNVSKVMYSFYCWRAINIRVYLQREGEGSFKKWIQITRGNAIKQDNTQHMCVCECVRVLNPRVYFILEVCLLSLSVLHLVINILWHLYLLMGFVTVLILEPFLQKKKSVIQTGLISGLSSAID
jgi:hypothetical protein